MVMVVGGDGGGTTMPLLNFSHIWWWVVVTVVTVVMVVTMMICLEYLEVAAPTIARASKQWRIFTRSYVLCKWRMKNYEKIETLFLKKIWCFYDYRYQNLFFIQDSSSFPES